MEVQKVKAYDLPVRIFHVLFAILFVLSFFIAKVIDDESVLYGYHMISGMLMAFLVVLRIIWGFVGSRTARFSSFKLRPDELVGYFTAKFGGESKRYFGHNPASSYAAVLMFVFTFALVGSGLMMVQGISDDFFEEIHEIFAMGFLVLVIVHIIGVVAHQLEHLDEIGLSMFHGKKNPVEGEEPIAHNYIVVGLVFLVLTGAAGSYLFKSYDGNTGKFYGFGMNLQLSENEDDENLEEDEYEKPRPYGGRMIRFDGKIRRGDHDDNHDDDHDDD
jgi:cytochrome b